MWKGCEIACDKQLASTVVLSPSARSRSNSWGEVLSSSEAVFHVPRSRPWAISPMGVESTKRRPLHVLLVAALFASSVLTYSCSNRAVPPPVSSVSSSDHLGSTTSSLPMSFPGFPECASEAFPPLQIELSSSSSLSSLSSDSDS
jgi:hypothetical protein